MSQFITATNNSKRNPLKNRSYSFSMDTIKFINQLPNKKVFWTIGDQLLRSATSVGANIIEAKASSSRREFVRFYEISLRSANETQYWLNLLADCNLVEKKTVNHLINNIVEINKMLTASIITLKNKRSY